MMTVQVLVKSTGKKLKAIQSYKGMIRKKKHNNLDILSWHVFIYINHNSDVQQHDQDQEVPRDANLSLMEDNRNCYQISSLILLFMTSLHRRPESSGIKWSS